MIVASIALVMLVMPMLVRPQNLTEIGFAAAYVLNWHLAAAAVDYLDASNPASIVQHFWSLSVEEQFYFIWPILLTVALVVVTVVRRSRVGSRAGYGVASGVGRRAGERRRRSDMLARRRAVFLMLAAVFVLSFVYSIIETAHSASSAYFVTTTRAWEFALGGLVAMMPSMAAPPLVRATVSSAALVAVLASAVLFGPDTPFPGAIALIPVGATAVLIWAGDGSEPYAPQRLAHNRPVQFIGDASYSIYLWHWPLIIVAAAVMPEMPEWGQAIMIVPLTLVLAGVTKRYVEDPVRRTRGILRRRGVTFAVMVVVVALIVTFTMVQTSALRAQVDQQRDDLSAQLVGEGDPADESTEGSCVGALAVLDECADPYAYTDTIDAAFAEGDVPWAWFGTDPAAARCTYETVGTWPERSCEFAGDGAHAILIGDSHAEHLEAPIQRVAATRGWELRSETRAACPLFMPATAAQDDNAQRCLEWEGALLDEITAEADIDVVIMSVLTAKDDDFTAEAVDGIRELQDAGKTVIVLADNPLFGGVDPKTGVQSTVPQCVSAADEVDDACAWKRPAEEDWLVAAAEVTDAAVIDPGEILCTDQTCHAIIGGLLVYTDEHHYTGTFSLSLMPWLRARLDAVIPESADG